VKPHVAIFLCAVTTAVAGSQTAVPTGPPTFRLFFLGHEIGREIDTRTTTAAGQHLDASFEFVDRGTTVSLTGALDLTTEGLVKRLQVKGRNYRLFSSDSEVTVAAGRAHMRDLSAETDVALDIRPFFPIDNYAPIGAQEALLQFWLSHRRPGEIVAPPAGTVRITSRGLQALPINDTPGGGQTSRPMAFERVAIDGLVWGTETAWINRENGELIAVTTWAGALPFEAIRDGFQAHRDFFIAEAVKDRLADLERLTAATPPLPSNNFALVGARVITGHQTDPLEDTTVVVRNGRIIAVGPSVSTVVSKDIPALPARGKTIIPGLWDMHAHASQVDWAPVYLASGVTTIRDLGGEEPFLIAIRDAIASGKALGPRYLLAGLIDGPGPRAFGMVSASTPDEAREIVRRYHDEHFQEIKIYIQTPAALVPVITEEAHKLGMTVTGHLPAGLTWQTAVEQGYDGIAHMQLRGMADADATKQQIAFFKSHNTVMDPTLSWNELSGRSMSQPLDALLPGASRLPRPLKRQFDSMAGGNGGSQVNSAMLIKAAVDAGLLVVAGTDKGVPGLSLQREIEIYVEGGLTPLQAIQAATIMPARAMKMEKDLGTIEVGKVADLVVLDANPLENISNIRKTRMVSRNGWLYDCPTLWTAAGFGK